MVPGGTASIAITAESVTTLSYFARDLAGNTEAAHSLVVRIDQTAPIVTYVGNAGTYGVDHPISIACSAVDPVNGNGTPGSGIASNTCADIAAPAYTFAAGINTFSATATDRAGNIGTSSASFTLQVAPGGLCNLTTGFIEGSPRFAALPPADRPPLVTAGAQLCNALSGATLPAPQKAFYIGIYQRGVMALANWGWLSSDQAAALVRLSAAL